MQLSELIQLKYPEADFFPHTGNVLLSDHNDGNGPVIGKWKIADKPQPTKEEIKAWKDDPEVIKQYQYLKNKQANAIIEKQLYDLNVQSMVHVRRNNQEELTKIEEQYKALEALLLPTQD